MRAARLIVDEGAWGNLEHIGPGWQGAPPAQLLLEPELTQKRLLDIAADALEPCGIIHRRTGLGVLAAEHVQRHAVGGGEDMGIDDAHA